MLIKCTEQHRTILMNYLNKDRVSNLFIVGDIENFGFNSDFQHIYMDLIDNKIITIYLVYRDSMVIASYDNILKQTYIDDLISKHGVRIVNGLSSIIDKTNNLKGKREDCYFAKMSISNQMINCDEVNNVSYEDLYMIAETRRLIFNNDRDELESLQHSHKTKSGRSVAIFRDNKAVSMASSTAECEGLAMVVGVGTLPEYRNNQYASKCITKLSNDLLKENKIPCLFYNNPSAGRIYKALGYQDIGMWSMIKLDH